VLPPVANRFVAGESVPEALDHARRANEAGVGVVLNLLGEHYDDRRDADADTAAYERLCADLAGAGLRACVSVKPTQLGLSVSEAAYRENYRRVAEAAADAGVFLWSDMEDATTTDATLDAVCALAPAFPDRLGVCLQANLRRTPEDAARLADLPVAVRLVKGAYDESPAVAHQGRDAVDAAYRALLDRLLEQGTRTAVGSHDPAMVEYGLARAGETATAVEVQMLMGVREREQERLAAEGVEVWQYAPYGTDWAAYFYRRVRERRRNLWFAARAVLG
jgi:proline dehydrogenase